MFVFQIQMRIEVDNKADAEKLTDEIVKAAESYGKGHLNSSYTAETVTGKVTHQIVKKAP